jgi:c-di-GMP-binding flagellar brake protein YcgR
MTKLGGFSNKRLRKKRNFQRLQIHILRIVAELKPLSQEFETGPAEKVRIILNDFSPTGMGFFSPVFLDFGFSLQITIEKPLFLQTPAAVVWCQEYQTSRKIISDRGKFTYRIGVEFLPQNEEQKAQIQTFFETLIQKHVLVPE